MSKIVIYGGRMGSSFRPHWMLAELGLEYETKTLDMKSQENRSPEYLAINPAGQIPAMMYGDFALTESAAIAHFLAEKHGKEFFGDNSAESRATQLRWELYVLLSMDKHFSTFAAASWGMPPTPEAALAAGAALAKSLPVFEGWLASREYVAGDTFTVADIVTRSSFNYAEMAAYDLSAYPHILAWMARCAARPAYAKAKQG